MASSPPGCLSAQGQGCGLPAPAFGTPVLLSLLAGLSTGLGGALAVVRRPSGKTIAALLGLSAGEGKRACAGQQLVSAVPATCAEVRALSLSPPHRALCDACDLVGPPFKA